MPGFAVLLVLLTVSARADKLKPTRRIEVTVPDSYSYEEPGPFGISYLSPSRLAVWFTDNTSGQLSRRAKLQPTDPWRMKLQIFDTTSGALQTREYPTHKVSTGMQVQADGTIILLNGPLVRCLSPDLRQTGSVNLPETAVHRIERVLANSPGGHAVWAFESARLVGASRIDAGSCKLTGNVAIPPSITSLSGNDSSLVATDKTHIATAELGDDWKTIYRADPCCIDSAAAANQNTILAYRDIPPPAAGESKQNHQPAEPKRSLLFLDSNGKTLLEEPLEGGLEPGPIIPSSSGKYALIAMPSPDLSSDLFRYRLLGAKYRVWIYDLSTLKRIAEFDVPRNRATLFAFALSPDARHVAVLLGSKIAIYDIPVQP
jgi:hypothetical protein